MKRTQIDRTFGGRSRCGRWIPLGIVVMGAVVTSIAASEPRPVKLHWFVPDGMRADPAVFSVFRWAEEGRLPNLRKMMKKGSYGYCTPTFPSHTPANFATMFTGAYPEVHGVNDGPMHLDGRPLETVSLSGFSSTAKKVEPIWVTLEKRFDRRAVLVSVPGSTPPELDRGVTIRGRWGRWGADFHSVIFQDEEDTLLDAYDPKGSRLFFAGPPLTQQVGKTLARDWQRSRRSDAPQHEASLSAWGATIHARIYDSRREGRVQYDRIDFSTDKKKILCTLESGEWSDWFPLSLVWSLPGKDLRQPVPSLFRIKVIRLEPDGVFRIRVVYNSLNRHMADPPDFADSLIKGAGPMVDFVDNFPPQLIYFPEDKSTFLEEATMSLDWHRRAASHLLKTLRPDLYIQTIYTPNQMLTSRWWMGYLDPASSRYEEVTEARREQLWREVHHMYRKLDDLLGEMIKRADRDTLVVLGSDHGAIPLDAEVRLNNLFAREGLLRYRIDPATGDGAVDWENSKAVYLKMHAVYVHPDGLGGNWTRASGPAYEALRDRVRRLLLDLRTAEGVRPVVRVENWEHAGETFRLDAQRTGDLIVANRDGFGWSEEITADREIFFTPLKTGYKQAVLAGQNPGMWTPFMIMGPGVKQGRFLGPTPVAMVDQYPTLLRLLGAPIPDWVQGRVLDEILELP